MCLGVIAAAAVLLLLWREGRERKRLAKLSRQIEHFLLYAEGLLPETLAEGSFANLSNQISQIEQLLLHRQEQSRRREEQVARFVENMAHQMKNAVTALQIQLDLLGVYIAPEEQALLEKSQACLERLTGEIDRILRSSQLAAGKIKMEFESLDLVRETAACGERLEPLARSRGVALRMQGPEQLQVLADGFWFSQALENVLKNAVEHTEEGTEVSVELSDRVRSVLIRVEDRGAGIPPEELSTLFTRFYRGSVTKAGYGIGLSMSRDIVEAHHGTLTAGNRDGGGAWFEISLPVMEGKKPYLR